VIGAIWQICFKSPIIKGHKEIEVLGPIIVNCIFGREADVILGDEIVKGQDEAAYKKWADYFFGTLIQGESFSMHTVRNKLLLIREIASGFIIKKRSD
jgi:hypothetical protein